MTKDLPTIHVFATKDSALRLVHPTHGPMTEDGATWPKDSFTSRRLTDGSVSLEDTTKAEVKASEAKPSKTADKPVDTDTFKS